MNAVHNIHTHLNLNGNEVRNMRLGGLPSDPDPVEGGVYFNLETGEFRFSDGTAWKSLLGGFWKLDDDGNLVTDKTVIVPNLIVRGDLSTDAKGSDAGAAGGIIGVKVGDAEYTDITAGILDMTEAFEGLDVDVDLSDYYTNEETDAKIAESLIPYAKITDVGSTYATKASFETLQGEVDNIEAILGMDEEAEGIINTWNEVKAFLDGYSSSDDLAAILSAMNADIAKRALDSDLDALAERVGVNELAIADNAGNIKKNFDAIGVLESNKADKATTLAGYGITDAYTKVNVDDLLKKYLLLEAESQTIKGDIRIEGNLIIAGDMSSEGTGGNSGADGTVIGVVVNGTQYADETNGILDLSTLMNQYLLLTGGTVTGAIKKPTTASDTMPDNYISAGGGFSTKTGRYGLKILVVDQLDAQMGMGADLFGDSYELSIATTKNNNYGKISFGYHEVNSTNYTRVGYFDLNGLTVNALTSGDTTFNGVVNFTTRAAATLVPIIKTAYDEYIDYRMNIHLGSSSGNFNVFDDAENALLRIVRATGNTLIGTTTDLGHKLQVNGSIYVGGDDFYGSSSTAEGGEIEFKNAYNGTYNAHMDVYKNEWRIWSNSTTRFAVDLTNGVFTAGGGTISGGSGAYTPLVVKNTNLSEVWIQFQDAVGTTHIGSANGVPSIYSGNGNQTLIHSGNIGSYALKTDGSNEMTGRLNMVANSIQWKVANGTYMFVPTDIFSTNKPELAYYNNGSWSRVAFTDSNVAGANKLVSGATNTLTASGVTLVDANGYQIYDTGSTWFAFGSTSAVGVYQGGSSVQLKTTKGYDTTTAVFVNNSGNVTIGASDLAGTKYKLYVSGGATAITGNMIILSNSAGFSGINFHINNTSANYHFSARNEGNKNFRLYYSPDDITFNALVDFTNGGNVLIGTTTDSGYKLDVNGNARFSKTVTIVGDSAYTNAVEGGELVLLPASSGNYSAHVDIYYDLFRVWTEHKTTHKTAAPFELDMSKGSLSITGPIIKPTTSSNAMADNYISAGGGYTRHTGKYGVKILCCDQADAQSGLGQDLSTLGVSNGYDLSIAGSNSAQDKGSISFVTHKVNSTTYRTLGYFKDDAGAVTFNVNGDIIMAGDLSSTSDMRLKQCIEDVTLDLKTIAEMPIFTFRWKDGRDGRLHLGSSAQYWEKPAPWLVMGDSSKTLNYAVLGVAGIKSIAVTTVDHETRIKMLERKVNELETENRRLRYGN